MSSCSLQGCSRPRSRPSRLDYAAETIRAEDVREVVLVPSDLARHVAWLQEIAELGVDEISIHDVGQEQGPFIEAFGERVLPKVMT
jgi:hypothetical protein